MTPEKRQWQPREMRLVAEYLAQEYPDHETQTRVRLGTIRSEIGAENLEPAELRAMGVWRRWADAIVFMPDRLILIEAKIRPQPGDISQLEVYEGLVHKTPELAEHKGKPVEKVLLYALEDPIIADMARERGIKVTYFCPDWIDGYLRLLAPRERRASRT
jgi:hypothetical protein